MVDTADVPAGNVNSIDVGGVKLHGRALLAPMSGITDAPFRRLAHRFGAALVVSEMVASHDLVNEKPDTLRRAAGAGGVTPLAIQLAGREPEPIAEAARIAEDLGADIIDINMGCPAKKVTGGLSGSALMREPAIAIGLIRAVRRAVSVPVTVKMRLGWDDTSRNAPELAAAAEAEGAAMITVHGRTRQQFYKGRADWSFIARVKDAVSVPVIANGDVECFADADRILEASGADGLMIGRGAQGRPWYPGAVCRHIAGETPSAQPGGAAFVDLLQEHYLAMLDHYGPEIGLRAARKHLGWYVERADLAPERAATWRATLCRETDSREVLRSLTEFGNEVAANSDRTNAPPELAA